MELIQNNDLFITSLSDISSGSSYTYFRGDTHTTTDYIIMNASYAYLVMTCKIHDHHPLNFSDHLPLSVTLKTIPTKSATSRNAQSRPRLNWQAASVDGSLQVYATKVNEIIRPTLMSIDCRYLSQGRILNRNLCLDGARCFDNHSDSEAKKGKKLFSNDPELRDEQEMQTCLEEMEKGRTALRESLI